MSDRINETPPAAKKPLITVLVTRLLFSLLQERGIPAEPFLSDLGIRSSVLKNPLSRIPVSTHLMLLDHAVRALDEENVGLLAGQRADPGRFGVFGAAMLTYTTPRQAMPTIRRVSEFYHDHTVLILDEQPIQSQFYICHAEDGHRQSGELLIAACISLARWMWPSYPLRAVYFAHKAPACTAEHSRFFRVPVHFDAGRNGYAFDTSNLDQPYPDAGAETHTILHEEVIRLMPDRGFLESVQHAITRGLLLKEGGAQWVSDELSISLRSLHRGLQERETTFRELFDVERQSRAESYLGTGRRTVSEIADLLGFSSPGAFRKAFKRWTGRKPTDMRSPASARNL